MIFAIVAYAYGLLQFESFNAYQFLFYGLPLVLTMLYVLKVLKSPDCYSEYTAVEGCFTGYLPL